MITWKMIPQIEKAFGFRLYKWQRNYLLGNRRYRTKHRRNGNTFAYCVKLLLSGGEPIAINSLKLGLYIDDLRDKKYDSWFARYLLEINDTLKKAGFETRIKESTTHPLKGMGL